jgi:hypothetical protein
VRALWAIRSAKEKTWFSTRSDALPVRRSGQEKRPRETAFRAGDLVALAAAAQDRAHVTAEAADLSYHLLLLLKLRDLTLADVVAELEGRHRPA